MQSRLSVFKFALCSESAQFIFIFAFFFRSHKANCGTFVGIQIVFRFFSFLIVVNFYLLTTCGNCNFFGCFYFWFTIKWLWWTIIKGGEKYNDSNNRQQKSIKIIDRMFVSGGSEQSEHLFFLTPPFFWRENLLSITKRYWGNEKKNIQTVTTKTKTHWNSAFIMQIITIFSYACNIRDYIWSNAIINWM